MNFKLIKAGLVGTVSTLAVACSGVSASAPQDTAQDTDTKTRHVMIERAGDHDVHVMADKKVKVIVGKDGEKKIWINGEEATEEELKKFEGKHGNVFVMHSADESRWVSKDGKKIQIVRAPKAEWKWRTDHDGEKVDIRIEEKDGEKKIWINGEEASEEELKAWEEKHGAHMDKMAKVRLLHAPKFQAKIAGLPERHIRIEKIARQNAAENIQRSLDTVRDQLDAARQRDDEEAVKALEEAMKALEAATESMHAGHFVVDIDGGEMEKVIVAELGELKMEQAELDKVRIELKSELAEAHADIAEAMAEIEMEVMEGSEDREVHIRVLRQAAEEMAEAEEHQLEALKRAEAELRRAREELERKLEEQRKKDAEKEDGE